MTTSSGFAGRSPDWKEGYQAGVDTFAAELKALRDRSLSGRERHSPEDVAFLREKGFSQTADEIERLIAEVERLKSAIPVWMTARGYATGHGDTIEDMLNELEAQVAARHRAESSW